MSVPVKPELLPSTVCTVLSNILAPAEMADAFIFNTSNDLKQSICFLVSGCKKKIKNGHHRPLPPCMFPCLLGTLGNKEWFIAFIYIPILHHFIDHGMDHGSQWHSLPWPLPANYTFVCLHIWNNMDTLFLLSLPTEAVFLRPLGMRHGGRSACF